MFIVQSNYLYKYVKRETLQKASKILLVHLLVSLVRYVEHIKKMGHSIYPCIVQSEFNKLHMWMRQNELVCEGIWILAKRLASKST
jgi:hypothetical protein